jgi:hypothetical protein
VISERCCGDCDAKPKHEAIPGLAPTSVDYLWKLHINCSHVKSAFDSFLQTVSMRCDRSCELKLMRLKSRKRCIEKASLRYNDDYSCVLDIIRSSFICGDVKDMIKIVRGLFDAVEAHSHVWQVLRYKNRMAQSYAPTGRGYRDVNMNLRHIPTGIVTEVQLHIRSMFEYDKEAGGQEMYEQIRCVHMAL